jgi:hypothetical protein
MTNTNQVRGRAAWLLAVALTMYGLEALPMDSGFVPPTAVLTREDFSEPESIPDRWQVTAGSWAAAGGTYGSTTDETAIATIYQYEVVDPASPPASQFIFDVFTYRARMRNSGTDAAQWVGLVYHLQDANNYFEAVFSPTGVAALRRVANGVTTTLATASYAGGGPGVWFDVDLIRDENLGITSVEVNGVSVFDDLEQREFEDGRVGLVTYGVAGAFDKVSLAIPFGEQPFKDPFTEPLTSGVTWFPQNAGWSVENGTFNNAAVEWTSSALLPINVGPMAETTLSYTLRARMLNPYSGPGNLVGVVFHHEGSRNFAEVVFSPTGVAQVRRILGHDKQVLATAAYAGRPNTWFDVKFELMSLGLVSVSVDGQRLFDEVATGDKFSGRFGLITHWSPGRFDDVWYEQGVFSPLSQDFAEELPSSWVRSGAWDTTGGTLNSTAVGIADIVATQCMCWDTDFRYSARLLNQFGARGNRVGLVYNYQTSGLYAGDYYEVEFSPTGIARLNKIIQGTRYLVASGTHDVPRNVWFEVEVVRSGASTSVLVNGEAIFEDVMQGELGAGDVGVVTHWARGRFDDLSVEEYVLR